MLEKVLAKLRNAVTNVSTNVIFLVIAATI